MAKVCLKQSAYFQSLQTSKIGTPPQYNDYPIQCYYKDMVDVIMILAVFLCKAKERALRSRFPVLPAYAHLESTLFYFRICWVKFVLMEKSPTKKRPFRASSVSLISYQNIFCQGTSISENTSPPITTLLNKTAMQNSFRLFIDIILSWSDYCAAIALHISSNFLTILLVMEDWLWRIVSVTCDSERNASV